MPMPMQMLELTQDQWVILGDAEIEWALQWKWCALWQSNTQSFYAVRQQHVPGTKRNVIFYLHREIARRMGLDMALWVDHKNGDTLDDQRENIRVVTRSQSQINRCTPRNNTSGIKGVSFNTRERKWHATVVVEGKSIYLGSFIDFGQAVIARKQGEAKYHGEFSR